MNATNRAILLIIDPQFDFCDPKGNLYVPGAEDDMTRLAKMIKDNINMIDAINVTLDSHQTVHITHPIWWTNSKGEHPTPFTMITNDDVKTGTWRATNPGMQDWSRDYMQGLADNGRYPLVVWNPHCLIGSVGATVHENLLPALLEWENKFKMINFVPKGSNFKTEHYSAVKADIEVSGDPTTMLNTQLINMLKSGHDILIAGEALDYCIANTIRDIANEFSEEEIKSFVLLEDATSSVNAPGVEHLGPDFVKDMTARGMRISKTTEYFG
jgi:nicotinamidase/pyrazinamidase